MRCNPSALSLLSLAALWFCVAGCNPSGGHHAIEDVAIVPPVDPGGGDGSGPGDGSQGDDGGSGGNGDGNDHGGGGDQGPVPEPATLTLLGGGLAGLALLRRRRRAR